MRLGIEEELAMEEQQPQSAKRRRRPSVRLGEIGYSAPYDASSMWIEAPRQQRKKQQLATSVLSTGKPGVKPPRIRPLEHLAAETAVIEEGWGVIEPVTGVATASGDEQKLVGDGVVKEQQQGKRRSSGFTPRKGNSKPRGKGPGGGRLGWTSSGKEVEASRPEPPPDADSPDNREDNEEEDHDEEDDEEEKESPPFEEAPISAETSSDSEELLGSELKGEEEDLPADDSGNGASDGSEEGDPGANPNSHGDEMQGAIEDGPGQVNGKPFTARKQQRQGERRSGRQAASRVKTSRDTVSIRDRDLATSRDIVIRDSGIRDVAIRDSVSREITAGEPSSGRFQLATVANGTTMIVTPNSSQRGMLSAGVSGWLQDLGLGKYSELFELNEVDTEVLPLLTFEDLREMGVDAVGARRKMFHGIQELGQIRGI